MLNCEWLRVTVTVPMVVVAPPQCVCIAVAPPPCSLIYITAIDVAKDAIYLTAIAVCEFVSFDLVFRP
jgi:hypothetical protein